VSGIINDVEQNGFAIVEQVIDESIVKQFLGELMSVRSANISMRAGKAYGIRNLLNLVPLTRSIANSPSLRALVEPVLGNAARVVRGIYFDKHKDANWKVAWHQDLSIAVRNRTEVQGYGPWSLKAGIQHVQPPVSILEKILTVRVHLDRTDESNGALRVFPGSHICGRLSAEKIASWKEQHEETICVVKKGGAMLMRPLLLHASSSATITGHRRVLHFEYTATQLPAGLEWFDRSL